MRRCVVCGKEHAALEQLEPGCLAALAPLTYEQIQAAIEKEKRERAADGFNRIRL